MPKVILLSMDSRKQTSQYILLAAVIVAVSAVVLLCAVVEWQQPSRQPTVPAVADEPRAGDPVVQTGHDPIPEALPATAADRIHAYAGLPRSTGPVTVLVNSGYVVGYCDTRQNPLWVCYRLSRVAPSRAPPRPSRFITDMRTQARVTHDAYTHSGYDRDHMAPNYGIATRYGVETQIETFRMSNVVPQTPTLNQGIWRRLEQLEADKYAQVFEDVWVITGPIFGDDARRLPSGVLIPDGCFKIILKEIDGHPHVLAFIIPQDVTTKAILESYLTSVREIERLTGLDFLADLPDSLEELLEMQTATALWLSPN